MRWLVFLVALPAFAQDLTLEAVAERYFKAQTYCDAGMRAQRWEAKHALPDGQPFTRCAHRDGRFKLMEDSVINWSDGNKHHRYFPYNRLYQQHSFDDAMHYDLYRNRAELFPVFIFRRFSSEPRSLTDPAERARYLKSFTRSALSTAEHTVFERMNPAYAGNGERIWVRNSDRVIVKHESLQRDVVMQVNEITSAEFDRTLGPAELSFDVPVYARFSLQSDPKAFLVSLFTAVLLTGCGIWAWMFMRKDAEEVLHHRSRLWRFWRWAFAIVAVLLGVLAVITSIGPDKGHPPAIVIVWVGAIWAAGLFALAASFLLASYPMQWLLGRARR